MFGERGEGQYCEPGSQLHSHGLSPVQPGSPWLTGGVWALPTLQALGAGGGSHCGHCNSRLSLGKLTNFQTSIGSGPKFFLEFQMNNRGLVFFFF